MKITERLMSTRSFFQFASPWVDWLLGLVLFAIVSALVHTWSSAPENTTRESDLPAVVGSHLIIPSVTFSSQRTVIAVLEPTCHACEESRDQIAAIISDCHMIADCGVRIVTETEPSAIVGWLGSSTISSSEISQVERGTVKGVFATPTLAIVDAHGVIKDLIVGKPERSIQADFSNNLRDRTRPAVSTEPAPSVRIVNNNRPVRPVSQTELLLDLRDDEKCEKQNPAIACVPLQRWNSNISQLARQLEGRTATLDCTILAASKCRDAIRRVSTITNSPWTVVVRPNRQSVFR